MPASGEAHCAIVVAVQALDGRGGGPVAEGAGEARGTRFRAVTKYVIPTRGGNRVADEVVDGPATEAGLDLRLTRALGLGADPLVRVLEAFAYERSTARITA